MTLDIRPLTQDERQAARAAAHAAILRMIGPRPERAQFQHHTASKYPPRVTRMITALCLLLLVAAFTPSAIRLYTIGSQTFGQTINNTVAIRLVGLATVLSAETGQVVFSLALATLGATRPARRLLYTSAAIATLIALVGNIQIALPGHIESPFAWFEAIAPPLLVLSTAYVLKEQVLDTIQERHAAERLYQEALTAWHDRTRNPESHLYWQQVYANALRDSLRKANNRRRDTLENMTDSDWRAAVWREFQADSWFEVIDDHISPARPTQPPVLAHSSNGNGRHN